MTLQTPVFSSKLQTTQRYAELSGRAGYNYASSSTVRHELDAFARRKTRAR